MSELKTLQEIQNSHGFHNLKTSNEEMEYVTFNKVNGGNEMAIFPSDLRKEIIKWIKISPKEKAKLITFTPEILIDEILRENYGICKALKKLFNISEEDLK